MSSRRIPCRAPVLLLATLAALCACGGSEAPAAAEEAGISEGNAAGESCIARYAESPCDLLTEEVVRTHVPAAPAEIERTDVAARLASLGVRSRSAGGIAQNGCRYAWDGGRTRARQSSSGAGSQGAGGSSVAGALQSLNRNLPVEDTVEIKSIQAIEAEDPLARFERKWSAPSDADRERLAQAMDEKMEEARREGELDERGAETGRNLGRSLAQAAIQYEPVEGVGTAARWGGLGSERELRVLDGDTEFGVLVDVSGDEAKNRELAIALARDLLARCRE